MCSSSSWTQVCISFFDKVALSLCGIEVHCSNFQLFARILLPEFMQVWHLLWWITQVNFIYIALNHSECFNSAGFKSFLTGYTEMNRSQWLPRKWKWSRSRSDEWTVYIVTVVMWKTYWCSTFNLTCYLKDQYVGSSCIQRFSCWLQPPRLILSFQACRRWPQKMWQALLATLSVLDYCR